jgi:serine/threonine protein kinase
MGEPRRRCSSYSEGVIFCPRDGGALLMRGLDSGRDPYLGQTLAGQFRLEALIGTGAVGRAYRAHQMGVERGGAFKILHQNLAANDGPRSRFRSQPRLAARLDRPNVVQVPSVSQHNHHATAIPFLVEYLDGLSLRSVLSARGVLARARALPIGLQIVDAVGEAHERGIVHHDLKAEDVMLVHCALDPDFVKGLDFGVARAEFDHASASVATHAGAIFGSARYVAPFAEQSPSSSNSGAH